MLQVYVKALYSYVHTYLLGFVFRTNPRGIPASIDSSARNLAENHSGIVRKIRVVRKKNVSYPCQVPYAVEHKEHKLSLMLNMIAYMGW